MEVGTLPKDNINDEATEGFRAEVSWNPNGWVQVATVNQRSTLTLPGEQQTSDHQPDPEPFDGWRVTLDRAGVNRMIRSLRRARDAAFGADA